VEDSEEKTELKAITEEVEPDEEENEDTKDVTQLTNNSLISDDPEPTPSKNVFEEIARILCGVMENGPSKNLKVK